MTVISSPRVLLLLFRRIIMQKKNDMFAEYPDIVSVEDLQKMLGGISRKLAYRLLASREIHSVRIGRQYKIPKRSVIAYLSEANDSDWPDGAA